jgi:two-component system sensor kinase FixL
MIFRLKTSGIFLDFRSDAPEDLLVAPETIIGRHVSTLPMPEDVKDGLMQTMLHAIETGKLLEYEYDLEIDGKTASFEARFVKSGPDESVCFVRNITERKRAQERIRQQQVELAHVARVSTMGEMAAGLAHEVNQPLSAIGNYAAACSERLRTMETGAAEELKEWVAEIENEAMRAGEIIRRLRYLVSKRRPARTILGLPSLIEEVIALVTPEARKLGVKIEFETSDERPQLEGDPVQIQQVLLNLMRNGLEAMQDTPESGRVLAVRCQPIGSAGRADGPAPEGDWLEVTIVDRGTGIPLEAVERVFDPFFTTKTEGMGMGLPISRSIIEAHGGRLEVGPAPDRGTISRFTLPVLTGSETDLELDVETLSRGSR